MANYRFVVNLSNLTLQEDFRQNLTPWAYLLAADKADTALGDKARSLRDANERLVADNGNFALVGQLADQFRPVVSGLIARIRDEERQLGRNARQGDLTAGLREKCTEVARLVRQDARQAVGTGQASLEKQLTLRPSHLIGAEDITLAVWLALNLEPEYLVYYRDDYRRFNASVARRAADQLEYLEMTDTEIANNYYPVASAVSYNTAYDAGLVFASEGLRRAAMGFGAYMADEGYTDHVYMGDRRIDLTSSLPNRYVRTVVVARGFWDGYRHEMGSPPEAFHFLGLGAPIMIGLVSLAAWGTRELTFDATSPMKDAGEGILYVAQPGFLKIRTRRIAFRLASEPGREWLCPCPFCAQFTAEYPFRYDLGRSWFLAQQRLSVELEDVRPGGPLFDAYPLLSEPAAADPLRAAVNFARIGHNHWVLEYITAELRRNSTYATRFKRYIDSVVEGYEANTSSLAYAEAVRFAVRVASGESEG